MNIGNVLVIVGATLCMLLAQSKILGKNDRRIFSLLGSAASILVAIEAAGRSEWSTVLLFTAAAIASLIGVAYDYLRSSNPDA